MSEYEVDFNTFKNLDNNNSSTSEPRSSKYKDNILQFLVSREEVINSDLDNVSDIGLTPYGGQIRISGLPWVVTFTELNRFTFPEWQMNWSYFTTNLVCRHIKRYKRCLDKIISDKPITLKVKDAFVKVTPDFYFIKNNEVEIVEFKGSLMPFTGSRMNKEREKLKDKYGNVKIDICFVEQTADLPNILKMGPNESKIYLKLWNIYSKFVIENQDFVNAIRRKKNEEEIDFRELYTDVSVLMQEAKFKPFMTIEDTYSGYLKRQKPLKANPFLLREYENSTGLVLDDSNNNNSNIDNDSLLLNNLSESNSINDNLLEEYEIEKKDYEEYLREKRGKENDSNPSENESNDDAKSSINFKDFNEIEENDLRDKIKSTVPQMKDLLEELELYLPFNQDFFKNHANNPDELADICLNPLPKQNISSAHPLDRDKNRQLFGTNFGHRSNFMMPYICGFSSIDKFDIEYLIKRRWFEFDEFRSALILKDAYSECLNLIDPMNKDIANLHTQKAASRLESIKKDYKIEGDNQFQVRSSLRKLRNSIINEYRERVNKDAVHEDNFKITGRGLFRLTNEKIAKKYGIGRNTGKKLNEDEIKLTEVNKQVDEFIKDEEDFGWIEDNHMKWVLKSFEELRPIELPTMDINDFYRQDVFKNPENLNTTANEDINTIREFMLTDDLARHMNITSHLFRDIMMQLAVTDTKYGKVRDFKIIESKSTGSLIFVSMHPNENLTGFLLIINKCSKKQFGNLTKNPFMNLIKLQEKDNFVYFCHEPCRLNLKFVSQYESFYASYISNQALFQSKRGFFIDDPLWKSLYLNLSHQLILSIDALHVLNNRALGTLNFGKIVGINKFEKLKFKDLRVGTIIKRIKERYKGFVKSLESFKKGFKMNPTRHFVFDEMVTSLEDFTFFSYTKQIMPKDFGKDQDKQAGDFYTNNWKQQKLYEKSKFNSRVHKDIMGDNIHNFFHKLFRSSVDWEEISFCQEFITSQTINIYEKNKSNIKGNFLAYTRNEKLLDLSRNSSINIPTTTPITKGVKGLFSGMCSLPLSDGVFLEAQRFVEDVKMFENEFFFNRVKIDTNKPLTLLEVAIYDCWKYPNIVILSPHNKVQIGYDGREFFMQTMNGRNINSIMDFGFRPYIAASPMDLITISGDKKLVKISKDIMEVVGVSETYNKNFCLSSGDQTKFGDLFSIEALNVSDASLWVVEYLNKADYGLCSHGLNNLYGRFHLMPAKTAALVKEYILSLTKAEDEKDSLKKRLAQEDAARKIGEDFSNLNNTEFYLNNDVADFKEFTKVILENPGFRKYVGFALGVLNMQGTALTMQHLQLADDCVRKQNQTIPVRSEAHSDDSLAASKLPSPNKEDYINSDILRVIIARRLYKRTLVNFQTSEIIYSQPMKWKFKRLKKLLNEFENDIIIKEALDSSNLNEYQRSTLVFFSSLHKINRKWNEERYKDFINTLKRLLEMFQCKLENSWELIENEEEQVILNLSDISALWVTSSLIGPRFIGERPSLLKWFFGPIGEVLQVMYSSKECVVPEIRFSSSIFKDLPGKSYSQDLVNVVSRVLPLIEAGSHVSAVNMIQYVANIFCRSKWSIKGSTITGNRLPQAFAGWFAHSKDLLSYGFDSNSIRLYAMAQKDELIKRHLEMFMMTKDVWTLDTEVSDEELAKLSPDLNKNDMNFENRAEGHVIFKDTYDRIGDNFIDFMLCYGKFIKTVKGFKTQLNYYKDYIEFPDTTIKTNKFPEMAASVELDITKLSTEDFDGKSLDLTRKLKTLNYEYTPLFLYGLAAYPQQIIRFLNKFLTRSYQESRFRIPLATKIIAYCGYPKRISKNPFNSKIIKWDKTKCTISEIINKVEELVADMTFEVPRNNKIMLELHFKLLNRAIKRILESSYSVSVTTMEVSDTLKAGGFLPFKEIEFEKFGLKAGLKPRDIIGLIIETEINTKDYLDTILFKLKPMLFWDDMFMEIFREICMYLQSVNANVQSVAQQTEVLVRLLSNNQNNLIMKTSSEDIIEDMYKYRFQRGFKAVFDSKDLFLKTTTRAVKTEDDKILSNLSARASVLRSLYRLKGDRITYLESGGKTYSTLLFDFVNKIINTSKNVTKLDCYTIISLINLNTELTNFYFRGTKDWNSVRTLLYELGFYKSGLTYFLDDNEESEDYELDKSRFRFMYGLTFLNHTYIVIITAEERIIVFKSSSSQAEMKLSLKLLFLFASEKKLFRKKLHELILFGEGDYTYFSKDRVWLMQKGDRLIYSFEQKRLDRALVNMKTKEKGQFQRINGWLKVDKFTFNEISNSLTMNVKDNFNFKDDVLKEYREYVKERTHNFQMDTDIEYRLKFIKNLRLQLESLKKSKAKDNSKKKQIEGMQKKIIEAENFKPKSYKDALLKIEKEKKLEEAAKEILAKLNSNNNFKLTVWEDEENTEDTNEEEDIPEPILKINLVLREMDYLITPWVLESENRNVILKGNDSKVIFHSKYDSKVRTKMIEFIEITREKWITSFKNLDGLKTFLIILIGYLKKKLNLVQNEDFIKINSDKSSGVEILRKDETDKTEEDVKKILKENNNNTIEEDREDLNDVQLIKDLKLLESIESENNSNISKQRLNKTLEEFQTEKDRRNKGILDHRFLKRSMLYGMFLLSDSKKTKIIKGSNFSVYSLEGSYESSTYQIELEKNESDTIESSVETIIDSFIKTEEIVSLFELEFDSLESLYNSHFVLNSLFMYIIDSLLLPIEFFNIKLTKSIKVVKEMKEESTFLIWEIFDLNFSECKLIDTLNLMLKERVISMQEMNNLSTQYLTKVFAIGTVLTDDSFEKFVKFMLLFIEEESQKNLKTIKFDPSLNKFFELNSSFSFLRVIVQELCITDTSFKFLSYLNESSRFQLYNASRIESQLFPHFQLDLLDDLIDYF